MLLTVHTCIYMYTHTHTALAVCSRKLQTLCTVNENMRLKSAGWDENGVLIYTTSNHIKYVLSNGCVCVSLWVWVWVSMCMCERMSVCV